MTISFHCPACQFPLRVPNQVAGRNGKCPQCGTIFVVPSESTPRAEGSGAQANPFSADPAVNPYDVGGVPARHFPELGPQQQFSSELPVIPQRADVSVILGLSFALWQRHLGLLVGTTLITIAAAVILQIIQFIVLAMLVELPDFEQGLAYHLVQDALQLTNFIVTLFFSIGQVQICLKLARNQPAEFVDLLLGGDRFLPVLGAWLLIMGPAYVVDYGLMFALSWGTTFGDVDAEYLLIYRLLYFVLAIAVTILFWPVPYLVIDRKAGIVSSYLIAFHVTDGNRWTSFLLAFITAVILLVGYMACLVGLLFAMPLVFLVWSVSYLMMAGQIPSYNWLRQPMGYR